MQRAWHRQCSHCICCFRVSSSQELYSDWFRGLCFLRVLHPLWLSYSFYLLFLGDPWALMGGFWWRHSVLRSLMLIVINIWLWASFFVPMSCRRKLLGWWLNKALINEYSRISLGTIYHYFFFSFLDQYYLISPHIPGLSTIRFLMNQEITDMHPIS